jgi:tetratricopeptide (TPR) repeat protein
MADHDNIQNDTDPTDEFDARCLQAHRSWEAGQLPFREAIARLTIYSQEAITAGHAANQGRAEQLLGNLQHFRGNLDISVRHWEHARKLFAQVNNRSRVAGIDLNIGESHRFQGNLEQALQLYRTAYKIAEEFGNLRVQTLATINQGLALLMLGQYDEAREAFDEGQKFTQNEIWQNDAMRIQRYSLLCEIYDGMATVYLHEGDNDAAWGEAAKALTLLDQDSRPRHRGYAYRTAGMVVSHLGESPDPQWPGDADEFFRIAMDAFREIHAEPEMARTTYAQAISLAEQGRQTTAARKFQQVIITFNRLKMKDDAARAAEAQLKLTT